MSSPHPKLDEKEVADRLQQLGFDTNDPEKQNLLKMTMEKLDKILTAKSASEAIMQDLHPAVRGRVEKLRDLQESYDRLEDEYLEEQRKLVLKYEALYTPLYEQRREIVNGKKDAEIEPVHMEGDDENEGSSSGEGGQGIPEFWACCIRANDVVSELITAKDDEVLKHLKDIRYELLGTPEGGEDKGDEEEEEEGFRLYFEFEKNNPFFDNDVLVKTYRMVDEEEGILEKSEGTTILWKPGKNVTVKVLRKKQKKGRAKGPAMTKTERCESFFNFFSPPDPEELLSMEDEGEEVPEEEMELLQEALQEDYEIGCIFKDKIIPHAVSWFTGEALEDEEGYSDEEGEEGAESDDGGDGGDDTRAQSNSQANTSDAAAEQPECKQQ